MNRAEVGREPRALRPFQRVSDVPVPTTMVTLALPLSGFSSHGRYLAGRRSGYSANSAPEAARVRNTKETGQRGPSGGGCACRRRAVETSLGGRSQQTGLEKLEERSRNARGQKGERASEDESQSRRRVESKTHNTARAKGERRRRGRIRLADGGWEGRGGRRRG